MSYILHIDTSAENSLVALAKDGALLSVINNDDARNHAATLNLHIGSLMAQNNITLQDVGAFCVCGGPGSYTGLRIGLATAKGFCYALDKPLMLHHRLLLIANSNVEAHPLAEYFIVVLQAREGEYFSAIFNRQLLFVKEPQHLTEADFEEFVSNLPGRKLCVGYIDEHIKTIMSSDDCSYVESSTINVATWVKYAYAQYICNEFVIPANSEPFYLKQVYTHNKKTIS